MALDAQGNHIPGTLPEGVPTFGAPSTRSAAEVGSPEFAEDRTQVNSLNNKHIFEAAHAFLTSERAQLSARLIHSFDELAGLTAKLNHQYLQGSTDRAVFEQGWEYNRQYDVANPVAVATGNNITAGGVPANRITDTTGAVAGGAVNAGIALGTLNNVSAQLGILQTMVDGLAQSQNTANTSIADTLATILGLLQKALANPTPATAAS
jgi:hypothetical protein